MSVLDPLIPLGILVLAVSLWAFFWAVRNGQFDDLDTPAVRILLDDDRAPPAPPENGAMPELTLATASLAGLLGSAHCVAMCGGIAAVLGATAMRACVFAHPLLYQLGPVASYGAAGAIAGSVGAATGRVLDVAAWGEVRASRRRSSSS
jgi:cbb3-type cytochrome oxidase maturation protein